MENPIQNKIGAVFVPVSNIHNAMQWYGRLLGLNINTTTHEGLICDISTSGETALILDAHKPVQNSSQPLFWFWTEDINAANTFLVSLGVEIVQDVQDIGSVSTLTFRDPDNNLLLLCQKH